MAESNIKVLPRSEDQELCKKLLQDMLALAEAGEIVCLEMLVGFSDRTWESHGAGVPDGFTRIGMMYSMMQDIHAGMKTDGLPAKKPPPKSDE